VDGARLFCARNEVPGSDVAVLDAETLETLTTISATAPTSVGLSPSGNRLYIAHQDSRVTVHDSTTYALLATVPVPATPLAIAVTSDGSHLYAALNDRSVADIDTTTDTVAGVVPDVATGSNLCLDVTFAKGKAYVPTGGGTGFGEGVTVIDVASRTITTRIPVAGPLEAAANLDESRVLVAREFGLSAIDTATNQVVASTALPVGPGRLALSPPPPFAGVIIDAPAQGARVQQPFVFGGWAVDVFGSIGGPGIDAVHVWAYPASGASPVFVGAADYGRPRPDVADLFGTLYLGSGYQMTVRGLTPGAYTLTAFGHSTRTGTFAVARQVSITVTSGLRMAVDAPVSGASAPGSFVVAGWALDGSAVSGSGIDAVHVWAYPSSGAAPMFAGAAALGHSRPDVAAAFGAQFGSAGYALDVQNLPAGTYTLIVYAHQASTGAFAAERAVSVTVTAPRPFIFIDLPATDATVGTSVRVAGWAIEFGAAPGTGVDAVHVWAYPSSGGAPLLVGVASYGASRPDVGAIFGTRYTPSGFNVTGSLPPGAYNIVAFAHSTTTNTFAGVRVVHVTVQ
jgi:YVTN family beta-propeller protein